MTIGDKLLRFALLVPMAMLVGACGDGAEPAAEQTESAPRETVFDPLVGTLDRARAVQQDVDQHAADLRRAIEESEQ